MMRHVTEEVRPARIKCPCKLQQCCEEIVRKLVLYMGSIVNNDQHQIFIFSLKRLIQNTSKQNNTVHKYPLCKEHQSDSFFPLYFQISSTKMSTNSVLCRSLYQSTGIRRSLLLPTIYSFWRDKYYPACFILAMRVT